MKTIRTLLAVFAGILIFVSCQKEYSLETGNTAGGAAGTLKDTLGSCQPITVIGDYQTNTPLTDSNYVLVQANITSPGLYIIQTDVQNGISFKDSGYIVNTGLQTITLKGSGIPLSTTQTEFTVMFGTSFCLFTITPTTGTGGGGTTAAFALAGTGTNCTNDISVQGTYTAGTALSPSNTVTLQVNVTTPGTYSINTGSQNGMTFSRAGTFAATGSQTVVLQGSGTPITAGNSTINISAGSSVCSFVVNVAQGSGGGGVTNPNDADSAWSFTRGGTFYHGPFDYVFDSAITGTGYTLNFQGSTFATNDTLLIFSLLMPGNTIQTGTYNTNPTNPMNSKAIYYFLDYSGTDPVTIDSSVAGTVGSNMQITISTYNPITRIITGTFVGTAKTPAGATVNIAAGKFTAKLE